MPRARRIAPVAVAILLALAAGPAPAFDLVLPGGGARTGEVIRDPGTYRVPVGPWSDGAIPTLEVDGRVVQQGWRISGEGLTTLQVMRPLIAQLKAAGFDILLDCAGQDCGGFDFRFGTDVLAAPEMFVDLFDYRFVSARRDGGEGAEYVTVLVSRSSATAYVQVIQAGTDGTAPLRVDADPTRRPEPRPQADPDVPGVPDADRPLAATLEAEGHVVLADLEFDTGSAALGPGPYPSLAALAAYLKADTTRRVALVGHTDTVGGLAPNVALSKRRAASVRTRLIEAHGVAAAQLDAEGMGYLAPVAPNLTPEGREANRRVEAVLLNDG